MEMEKVWDMRSLIFDAGEPSHGWIEAGYDFRLLRFEQDTQRSAFSSAARCDAYRLS
jgi:hypothetical protein